jgi:hypothetical protein
LNYFGDEDDSRQGGRSYMASEQNSRRIPDSPDRSYDKMREKIDDDF